MKDIRINGRNQRVFVLKETDERVVYIPVKALHHVDYIRLKDIEAKGGVMLDRMSETTLDNGRNALVQYDDLIQVLVKTGKNTGERLLKPDEAIPEAPVLTQVLVETKTVEAQEAEPERRRPGRPPKNQQV